MTSALKDFCELNHRDPDTVERQLLFTFPALNDATSTNQPSLHELFRFSSLQPELHYIIDVALTLLVMSSCAERAFQAAACQKPSANDNVGFQITEFA